MLAKWVVGKEWSINGTWQTAYVLVSSESRFSHSQLRLVSLSACPSSRTALGPVVWLQGEAGHAWPLLTLLVESTSLREPSIYKPFFLSRFATPYTTLHTSDCGGHTCTHAHHTNTLHTYHTLHTYTKVALNLGMQTLMAMVAFGSPAVYVATVHFSWDIHTDPLHSV